MQNLNYFLVVCAAAATVCVVPMSHAQDTEAQAKARQALRDKLNQLDGTAPAPQDTEAQAKAREALRKGITQAPPVVAQPATAQPAAAAAPVTITMSPATPPADAQAIEKARQAVRQQLDQLNSGSPDSPEVAKARQAMRQKLAEAPQPASVEAQIAQPPKATQKPEDVQATETAAKTARAQAEAQSKAEKAAQVEADKAEAAAQAARRAKRDANLSPTAFQPIESPALPISNEKQQRLAELLSKYRADQITPEQYHQERAKILGEQ